MLKLFDKNHNAIGYIAKYKDCKTESDVSTGDKSLSFTYLAKHHNLANEMYVRNKEDEYVIKEVSESSDGFPQVVAALNLEELEAEAWQTLSFKDTAIDEAARIILAGTGWKVGECDVTKHRNAGMMQVSSLGAIQNLCTAFMCEPVFDTINKTVSFYGQRGEDKGVYFMSGLNLRKLQKKSSSYDFYTRIIPIGADGLTIESVNGGKNYLENYQYSDKVRTYIWKDESYTDAQALKEDAEKKLEDLSKPEVSYSADIRDLAKQKPGYSILSYKLGDTVTLVDRDTGTKGKQRIMKLVEYEDDPDKNTCEIGNTFLTFEEMQEKLRAAAELAGNTITGDGKIYVSNILNFEKGLSESVTVGGIQKNVSTMQGNMATMQGDIAEVKAKFGELDVNFLTAEEADIKYATIANLNATDATVHSLQGDYAQFKTTATDELSAHTARLDTVTGDLANYKTVIAQELVTAKGWMLEGAIGSAQISDLDVTKLNAGILDTAIVNIAGSDGRLQIVDNTIQISDADRIRVQVGKDASGDYTLAVWDTSGNLIWDALGATENTIQRKIIRDKMVADDANIQGYKLDIESVIPEINGATAKISGTVVQVGNKTLNVALSEQTQLITEHGATLTDHAARITASENAISLKVSTQDFNSYKTTVTGDINTAKNAAISAAASDATTKANNAKAAAVSAAASDAATKANQALADAKNYTNAEITAVNKSLSTTNQEISVMKGQIALKVEQTDIDTAVSSIQIGGKNLLLQSATKKIGQHSGAQIAYQTGVMVSEWRAKDAIRAYGTGGTATVFGTLGGVSATPVASVNGTKYVHSVYIKNNGTNVLRIANNLGVTQDVQPGAITRVVMYGTGNGVSNVQINFATLTAGEAFDFVYWHPQIEIGTKVTDWAPAPEDVDASITAVDNKFASYSTTTQMQSAITAAKDSITQSVSSTYATKASVNTVSGNVTTLTSRVSAAEQKLTKDSLVTTIGSYYATASYVGTAIDGIEIGGRNLIANTGPSSVTGWTASSGWTVSLVDCATAPYGKAIRATNGTATSGGVHKPPIAKAKMVNGEKYTISAWIRASKACTLIFQNEMMGSNTISVTTAWQKYTFTSTINTGATYSSDVFYVKSGIANGMWIEIHSLKLEKGTKATDWTPAPEDMDASIASVKTIATQTADKFNWLVKSGTSATDFTLTDRTATLVANAINLKGLVAFSGLDSTAQGKINTAQSTADTAKSNAATAQSTANTAKTNAAAAQTTANTAKTNAATAQSTADAAKTAAANAQTTANTANTRATYHYGTCATAAATVAKVVTLSGFSLYTGATISVKFTYANTAASPTLNVNNTGAKAIYVYGAALAASSAYNWVAGATVQFTYNGTQWVMTDTSAMKAMANWCHNNNLSYINGGKIYAGTVEANQIAANAVTAGKIASGAITTDKLAANAVTAAKINVNDLFAQDITATGTITGAKLVGATGSFTGSIIANDIVIKETIKMRGADSTTDRNAVMLNDYGGTLKIDIGDPGIDTDEFQTFVALNGNTILLNGTVQAWGGGIDASSNQIKCGELKCSSAYATGEIRSGSGSFYTEGGKYISGQHSNSWISVLRGEAGLDVQTAGASTGFNGLARVKCTSGAWALGALNTNNGFYLVYGNENRLNSGTNGADLIWAFYSNGIMGVPSNIECSKSHGLYSSTTGTNIIRQADMTNYSNCTVISNTNYPVSIYTNGNVWKNGSSSTYFATTSSSDKRLKEYIGDMSDYEEVFMGLSPIAFRYHDGLYNAPNTKPLIQWGFYAQDVIKAFEKNCINWRDQELVVVENGDLTEEEQKYVRPGTLLKMNYQNLTALSTHMIQKNARAIASVKSIQDRHTAAITSVTARQDAQESWIESLQYQLNEARAQIAQQAAEIARMKGMLQAVA